MVKDPSAPSPAQLTPALSRVAVLRTTAEAREARRELGQCLALRTQQEERMPRLGFTEEQVLFLSRPLDERIAALEARLEAWRRLRSGDVETAVSLSGLGTRLAQLRVASGMSQRDLARAMGVSDSQVSRDERTLYAGVTVKRALRVLAALGLEAEVAIQPVASE